MYVPIVCVNGPRQCICWADISRGHDLYADQLKHPRTAMGTSLAAVGASEGAQLDVNTSEHHTLVLLIGIELLAA